MRFDYELIVFCGIIALGVVHLIDMRLKWLRIRKALRAIEKNGSARGVTANPESVAELRQLSQRTRGGERFHRVVMVLLVVALIWSGILVWVDA